MEKKYELIPSDKKYLYRIKALKSFSNVKKGDIGGYVQSENNLSQYGNCWIYDSAKVCGNAVVRCDAQVCGVAVVRGHAVIQGNAKVCGNAVIQDNATIQNNARIWGNAKVWGHVQISDNALVYGDAQVWNHARIYDDAIVRDNAQIWDNATVRGNAQIWEKAEVWDNAIVYGNAKVCGNAEICGKTDICGDAIISSNKDYIVFKNWWSSGRYFTWTRSNNKWKVGCFYGTGEELIAEAYKDSEEKGREYERIVKYVEGEDKPSEWSIEDERNIRDCIFYLENAKKYFEKDDNILFNEKWFNLCIEWLKSLSPQTVSN